MASLNIWGENSYKINMAILKLDPYNCAACTRLAKYFKLGDNMAEAKSMYLRALEIDPKNRGAINNLSELEKDQKEEDAVNQIQTIGDLLREGQKAMLKDRYTLAVKLFAKVFGLEPSLRHAVSLAGAYEKVGRYDRIEKVYRQLIDDNSGKNDVEAIENEFRTLRSNSNIRPLTGE
jgi:tetratricopeptide (TPR) repeat protein